MRSSRVAVPDTPCSSSYQRPARRHASTPSKPTSGLAQAVRGGKVRVRRRRKGVGWLENTDGLTGRAKRHAFRRSSRAACTASVRRCMSKRAYRRNELSPSLWTDNAALFTACRLCRRSPGTDVANLAEARMQCSDARPRRQHRRRPVSSRPLQCLLRRRGGQPSTRQLI